MAKYARFSASDLSFPFLLVADHRHKDRMCGRYVLQRPRKKLPQTLAVAVPEGLFPRFNIAPSQEVAVVRAAGAGEGRELVFLRWGLIPSWANDLVRPVHAWMPVILESKDYGAWLDPTPRPKEELVSVLRPDTAAAMVAYLVSARVNSPRSADAGCVELGCAPFSLVL